MRCSAPSLEAAPGDTVTFGDGLLLEREGEVRVGTPSVEGASVAAEVVGHGRGDKSVVYKMKRRKGLPAQAGPPPRLYRDPHPWH